MGMSYFPKEVIIVPRMLVSNPFPIPLVNLNLFPSWKKLLGNAVFESEHTRGGHFAAHEKPELLVGDVRKMFAKNGPAFGVVPGKTGYA